MPEIPKAYEPQAVEERWYQFWLKENCFVADARSPKPAYSLVIPPPTATRPLHTAPVPNDSPAECDGDAAHGPCAQQYHPGHPVTEGPNGGQGSFVAAGD